MCVCISVHVHVHMHLNKTSTCLEVTIKADETRRGAGAGTGTLRDSRQKLGTGGAFGGQADGKGGGRRVLGARQKGRAHQASSRNG